MTGSDPVEYDNLSEVKVQALPGSWNASWLHPSKFDIMRLHVL